MPLSRLDPRAVSVVPCTAIQDRLKVLARIGVPIHGLGGSLWSVLKSCRAQGAAADSGSAWNPVRAAHCVSLRGELCGEAVFQGAAAQWWAWILQDGQPQADTGASSHAASADTSSRQAAAPLATPSNQPSHFDSGLSRPHSPLPAGPRPSSSRTSLEGQQDASPLLDAAAAAAPAAFGDSAADTTPTSQEAFSVDRTLHAALSEPHPSTTTVSQLDISQDTTLLSVPEPPVPTAAAVDLLFPAGAGAVAAAAAAAAGDSSGAAALVAEGQEAAATDAAAPASPSSPHPAPRGLVLDEAAYRALVVLMRKLLLPPLLIDPGADADLCHDAHLDWRHDVRRGRYMGFPAFAAALVCLLEVLSPAPTAAHYASIAEQLLAQAQASKLPWQLIIGRMSLVAPSAAGSAGGASPGMAAAADLEADEAAIFGTARREGQFALAAAAQAAKHAKWHAAEYARSMALAADIAAADATAVAAAAAAAAAETAAAAAEAGAAAAPAPDAQPVGLAEAWAAVAAGGRLGAPPSVPRSSSPPWPHVLLEPRAAAAQPLQLPTGAPLPAAVSRTALSAASLQGLASLSELVSADAAFNAATAAGPPPSLPRLPSPPPPPAGAPPAFQTISPPPAAPSPAGAASEGIVSLGSTDGAAWARQDCISPRGAGAADGRGSRQGPASSSGGSVLSDWSPSSPRDSPTAAGRRHKSLPSSTTTSAPNSPRHPPIGSLASRLAAASHPAASSSLRPGDAAASSTPPVGTPAVGSPLRQQAPRATPLRTQSVGAAGWGTAPQPGGQGGGGGANSAAAPSTTTPVSPALMRARGSAGDAERPRAPPLQRAPPPVASASAAAAAGSLERIHVLDRTNSSPLLGLHLSALLAAASPPSGSAAAAAAAAAPSGLLHQAGGSAAAASRRRPAGSTSFSLPLVARASGGGGGGGTGGAATSGLSFLGNGHLAVQMLGLDFGGASIGGGAVGGELRAGGGPRTGGGQRDAVAQLLTASMRSPRALAERELLLLLGGRHR